LILLTERRRRTLRPRLLLSKTIFGDGSSIKQPCPKTARYI
jgi:hypothetical protein